ncbi:MAG TPA: hypothetical protein VMS00_04870 [Acidimicrobiales bacterium]|nr:hypothetical protein [Acidimicrobiales bacterium]
MKLSSTLAKSAVALIATICSAIATAPGVATAAGNFNSCSVVTRAEAASALGQPVTAGVLGHATVEGGLACVFYGHAVPLILRNANVPVGDSVRVVVVEGPNALKWYKDYESKVKAQPVSGIGNKAFFDGYASLSVFKGNYYLRDAVSPPPIPSPKKYYQLVLKDEEQLAKSILAKL